MEGSLSRGCPHKVRGRTCGRPVVAGYHGCRYHKETTMSCFLLHPIHAEKHVVGEALEVLSNRFGVTRSPKDLELAGLAWDVAEKRILEDIRSSQAVCVLEERGFLGKGTFSLACKAMKMGRPIWVARQRFLGPLPWGWDILRVQRLTVVDDINWRQYAVVEV